jgi:hypothetical protein
MTYLTIYRSVLLKTSSSDDVAVPQFVYDAIILEKSFVKGG